METFTFGMHSQETAWVGRDTSRTSEAGGSWAGFEKRNRSKGGDLFHGSICSLSFSFAASCRDDQSGVMPPHSTAARERGEAKWCHAVSRTLGALLDELESKAQWAVIRSLGFRNAGGEGFPTTVGKIPDVVNSYSRSVGREGVSSRAVELFPGILKSGRKQTPSPALR